METEKEICLGEPGGVSPEILQREVALVVNRTRRVAGAHRLCKSPGMIAKLREAAATVTLEHPRRSASHLKQLYIDIIRPLSRHTAGFHHHSGRDCRHPSESEHP